MKLAWIAPGQSNHTMRWTNSLVARGHEVHLISMTDPHAADRPDVRAGLSPRVDVHLIPPTPRKYYPKLVAPLHRLVAGIEPDIVHAHGADRFGLLARFVRHRPTVLSVWGSDVLIYPDERAYHAWLMRGNLRFPDHVCATSRLLAATAVRLGANPDRMTVTPFGIDTSAFTPSAQTAEGTVMIGTVRRQDHRYGIDLLLRAFVAARERLDRPGDPRIGLRIVGDGPMADDLRRLGRDLGLDPAVFTGRVAHADVPEELHGIDVFVAPSRSEGFGVSVLEASASGLPVIVSDAGALPEVVADGETGIVVPGEDVGMLADAIVGVARDPDLRARFGAAGRRRVLDEYSWDHSVDVVEDVYARVLAP